MTYLEVSCNSPCRICGKPDWCRRSGDGTAFCRRLPLADSSTVGKVIHDRNGAEVLVVPSASAPKRPERVIPPSIVTADPDTRNRVYCDLIEALPLWTSHSTDLRRRGLSDDQIVAGQYRTLPLSGRKVFADAMMVKHGLRTCASVPGLYVDSQKKVRIAGAPGLLIPVRDLDGRVVALKVRADSSEDGSNRYTFVSSRKYDGPGPGAPVHVPLWKGKVGAVRITEGELKADVATALTGILTISVPGVSSWRSALPVLDALSPSGIRVAFDMDWLTNPVVRAAMDSLIAALTQQGRQVEVETWD